MARASNVIPFPRTGKKDRYRRDLKWAPIKDFDPVPINFQTSNAAWARVHLTTFRAAAALADKDKAELAEVLAKLTPQAIDDLFDDLTATKEHLRAIADVIGMVTTRMGYIVRDRNPANPEAA